MQITLTETEQPGETYIHRVIERERETEQLIIMEEDSKKGKRPSSLMKVDNRIRILIENGVAKQHRSLFVIVGDRGKDQVCDFVALLSSSFIFNHLNHYIIYNDDEYFS